MEAFPPNTCRQTLHITKETPQGPYETQIRTFPEDWLQDNVFPPTQSDAEKPVTRGLASTASNIWNRLTGK